MFSTKITREVHKSINNRHGTNNFTLWRVSRRAILPREVNLLKPRRSHPASVPKLKSHNSTVVRSDKSVLQREGISAWSLSVVSVAVSADPMSARG